MPYAAKKICTAAACRKFAVSGGRCKDHQRKPWDHKKSRHERGYDNNWYKLRAEILTRDSNLCQACLKDGIYTPATQVDHIIPKSEGGTNDRSNLQSICKKCHDTKSINEAKRGVKRWQKLEMQS